MKTLISGVAAVALGIATASAELIDNAPQTYGPASLNFTSSLSYPGFVPPDPSCVLEKVHVRITGELSGYLGIENLSALYPVETYFLQAIGSFRATLNGNNYTTFVQSPALDETTNAHGPLVAYDGTLDYSGASGDSLNYVASTDFTDHVLDSPADLAFFTNPSISVAIKGSKSIVKFVGSEAPVVNTADLATSEGSITIDIDYEYSCDVPDGSISTAVALLGLIGVADLRRRLKK